MSERIHDYSREEHEARREFFRHPFRYPLTPEELWEEDVREFRPYRRREEDGDEDQSSAV